MAAWSVLATYGVLKVFHKYTPILGAQMSRMKFGPADKPVMDALQRLSGPGGGKTVNQDLLTLGQYVGRNLRPVGGASRDLALVGGAGDFGSALISLMESETLTWAGASNAFDNALRHTPEHVVFGLAFMGHGALKQSARAGAALKAHQKGLAQYREHHSRTDIDGLEGAVERMYIASHYLRQHQMPEFMRARLLSDTMDSMPRMTDQQVVDFRNAIARDIQAYESNVSILKQGRDSGLSAEHLVELEMQTTAQLGFARAGREILSRVDSQLARRGIQPVGSKPADPASPKAQSPFVKTKSVWKTSLRAKKVRCLNQQSQQLLTKTKTVLLTGHSGQGRVLTSNTVLNQVSLNQESQIHANQKCQVRQTLMQWRKVDCLVRNILKTSEKA